MVCLPERHSKAAWVRTYSTTRLTEKFLIGVRFIDKLPSMTVRELPVSGKKAYVVDGPIAQRFGKKMLGVSSHVNIVLRQSETLQSCL